MGEAGVSVQLMGEQIYSREVEVISTQRCWSEDSSLALAETISSALLGCSPRVGPF